MISLEYLAETPQKPLWDHIHNLDGLEFPQKKHSPLQTSSQ